VINYGATLDVARELVWFVARLLQAERRRRGTRRARRALTPYWQAVLVLRWFRDATPVHRLATDHRISIATAYRYLHEAITALAAQAHFGLAGIYRKQGKAADAQREMSEFHRLQPK